MPSYQPEGSVYIGVVPFDNSYRHTMTFASRTAQAQFMRSCCNQAFDKNTYSYVRMNNSIRVDFNAERLYNYNYVMYQNSNYGQKWFYAFIVGVNYINENVTELVLELDVIQTYWFDLTLTKCMVEREHVNEDEPGDHLNAEPSIDFLSIAQDRFSDGDLTETMIVIQTANIPSSEASPEIDILEPTSTNPATGGCYNHIYSGCAMFAFTLQEYSGEGDNQDLCSTFLSAMSKAGAADTISNVFLFPKKFLPPLDYYGDIRTPIYPRRGTSPKSVNHYIAKPTTVDGYTPRNKKLLTFPYCYCQFDDNNGHSCQYRWEFWESVIEPDDSMTIPIIKSGCKYSVSMPLDSQATVFCTPQNYNGIENNASEAYTFPFSTMCSWPYGSYDNMVSQNKLSLAFDAVTFAIGLIPMGRGVSLAAKALGAGIRGAKALAKGAKHVEKPMATIKRGIGDFAEGAMESAPALGQAAGTLSELYKESRTPNITKGNAAGNSLYSLGYMTYNQCTVAVRREFAEMIDEFFDMYGYAIERVKVPNVNGRRSWNYVKCQNSCHKGNMPANFLDQINDIFDAGITFWHTSDVGNYSLDNSIV